MSATERDPHGVRLQRAVELEAQLATARSELARLKRALAAKRQDLDRILRPDRRPLPSAMLGLLTLPVALLALVLFASIVSALFKSR